MAKLKKCSSCSHDVDRSAKSCPNCGKKLKMGFFLKLIIFVIVLGVISAIFSQTKEEKEAEIKSISSSKAESIDTSELKEMFSIMSKNTDLQRENKEKELIGKIVQWKIEVYEVNKSEEYYRIQGSTTANMPGTFVSLYPRNDSQRQRIESLKTGDSITFKGIITGTTVRNIDIDKATLID
jgi:hypothetical protein